MSSMGDVVMTTPIARCIHRQLGAEVHYLTKAAYQSLLQLDYISKVYLLDKQKQIDTEILRKNNYDIIVDLHNNLRSRKLCLQLSKPVLRTDKMPIRKWLFLKLRIDLLKSSHVIDRHFNTVKSLDVLNDGLGMEVPQQYTNRPTKKHIAIVLGGTYITKRIPQKLAKKIILQFPEYTFHILGGDDINITHGLFDNIQNVNNHIGQLDLPSTISRMSQCILVITGDTGLMHIAAALQKPMISVWGSTSTKFGFAPHYGSQSKVPHQIIENNELKCRPCSKYGVKQCPKGHMNCLEKIKVTQMNTQIENMMNSAHLS